MNALIIDKKDNVATAVSSCKPGDSIVLEMTGRSIRVKLIHNIPLGHKFALKNIEPGEPVIKYGEVIGLATVQIRQGEHVHIHNVEGQRGRGDKL